MEKMISDQITHSVYSVRKLIDKSFVFSQLFVRWILYTVNSVNVATVPWAE